MKFYWLGDNRAGNFGDILTPYVLDYFKIPFSQVKKHTQHFDAICIGSIARYAKSGTLVLGSGFLSRKNNVCKDADYRFVRGPFSRNMILNAGGKCPEIYGDPGLLLPLFCDESKKEYDIGIIPHYSHYSKIKNLYSTEFVINLLTDDALSTAKQISKCRRIISGSLHGIIAANAYGIPAAWIDAGGIKGDNLKFEDYFLSVGIENPIKSSIDNPIFYCPSVNTKNIENIFISLLKK